MHINLYISIQTWRSVHYDKMCPYVDKKLSDKKTKRNKLKSFVLTFHD